MFSFKFSQYRLCECEIEGQFVLLTIRRMKLSDISKSMIESSVWGRRVGEVIVLSHCQSRGLCCLLKNCLAFLPQIKSWPLRVSTPYLE
jgi:hypothetical protein